jgi:[protein-PII] uridylyltransferase
MALDGESDVVDVLQKRDHESAQRRGDAGAVPAFAVPAAVPAPPKILWHDGVQSGYQLVEVRASDRTGLLAVLTAVFERAGVDISWAKITTVGSSVIDVFAISALDSPAGRETLERDLYAALPAPPPSPQTEAGPA